MHIFKSIKRNLIKRSVVQSILEKEQHNNDVVNIHRIDKKNIGDFYCAPHHYFDVLKGKSLDIFDYKSEDKETWQIFEDEKNISIHLKDLKPEIYTEVDEKFIKENTFKYFEEYPIVLIKEKLKDFFEIIR